MARRIVWTNDAVKDIEESWEYISRDSSVYAIQFVQHIRRAVRGLIQFPYKARPLHESGRDDLRELIAGNYRVIFRVSEKRLTILRILHSSRDLPRHFDPSSN